MQEESDKEIRTYISEKESNIVRGMASISSPPYISLPLLLHRNVMTKQLQELQCLQVLLQHDIGKPALVAFLTSSFSYLAVSSLQPKNRNVCAARGAINSEAKSRSQEACR